MVAIPVALGGGVLRLIREKGVTVQAVAGALAIYLLVGLLFASAISFAYAVDSSRSSLKAVTSRTATGCTTRSRS